MTSRAILTVFLVAVTLGIVLWVMHNDTADITLGPSVETNYDFEIESAETQVESTGEIVAAEMIELELKSEFEIALEKISPAAHDYYRDETRTYIQVVKGDIGSVDVVEIMDGDLDSLVTLLRAHSGLTNATDRLDLELVEFRQNNGMLTAIYRQKIGGMPIDRLSSVDFAEDGFVLRLRSLIVDPSIDLVQPTVLEAEAIAHAINTLSNKIGYEAADVTVSVEDAVAKNYQPPTLYYRLTTDNEPPSPYWRVSMQSKEHGQVQTAIVDALTGETEILTSIQRFNTRVCEQGTEVFPTCEEPGPDVVFEDDANGDRDCVGAPGDCAKDRNRNPWDVMDRLEGTLESNAPNLCCAGVGGSNNRVDIMTDAGTTIANGNPGYSIPTDTVIIPDPSTLDPDFKSGTDLATDADEILVHENAHAVICGIAQEEVCESQDLSIKATREGLADVITAIYSDKYDPSGDTWVIGEGVYEDPDDPGIRDISDPQEFPSADNPESQYGDDEHEYSKVISHVFYKLSEEEGVSMADLTKLVLDVATNIDAEGGSEASAFDIDDFIDALKLAAANISTSMSSKVDQVIDDMTVPPGIPGAAIEHGSCSGSIETFNVTWWQGATGGYVDSYKVEYKVASVWDDWYDGGSLCIPHSASGTVYFRVKVFNAGGESDWKNLQKSSYCGGGGQPF